MTVTVSRRRADARSGGRPEHGDAHQLRAHRRRAQRAQHCARRADDHRAGHQRPGGASRPTCTWRRSASPIPTATRTNRPTGRFGPSAPAHSRFGKRWASTGVERLHTHMGDGIFINSRAGQISLAANTDHELRVRFRDDAGSVSSYARAAVPYCGRRSRDVPVGAATTWPRPRAVPGKRLRRRRSSCPPARASFRPAIRSSPSMPTAAAIRRSTETVANRDRRHARHKYLNFGEVESGFIVTPSSGSDDRQKLPDHHGQRRRGARSHRLATVRHQQPPSRAPTTAPARRSLDADRFRAASAPGYVAQGGGDDFRNTLGPTVNVTNNTAYTSYKMIFTGVKNATQANSMQIAEIQFFGDRCGTPPSLRAANQPGRYSCAARLPAQRTPPATLSTIPRRWPTTSPCASSSSRAPKTLNLEPDQSYLQRRDRRRAHDFPAGDRSDIRTSGSICGSADDGSTYYGTAAQTEPDFSMLARASESILTNPFVPMQPGYVVEQVGSGYRLPVNIAFVPNPGPIPTIRCITSPSCTARFRSSRATAPSTSSPPGCWITTRKARSPAPASRG